MTLGAAHAVRGTYGEAAAAPPVFRHPYAKLAVNSSFSALWLAQVVSSLGDRVHQIALVFLVLRETNGSPFAVGLAFALATIPSALIGPVAGAYVDRWDRKRVMVMSDIIRGAAVIAIPVAAAIHIALVYPLVLAIAVIATFFRPARVAALSQVVHDDELLAANSAMWVGETLTDVAGYPLAGLFVAFLGPALSLAFWLDGASYLASAAMVAAIAVPWPARVGERARSIGGELMEGWRYLWKDVVLRVSTAQAAVAQYGTAALTALAPTLIAALPLSIEKETAYGYFETAIGIGAVFGGVAIGSLAGRVRKGATISAAFLAFGGALAILGFSGQSHGPLPAALLFAVILGTTNVAFVVPSITLFQERTPAGMLGRVIAIRLAIVNALLAISMVTSSLLAEVFGVSTVLIACGALTAIAGLAGFLVPAIREA